ncbi:MAG: hypothetical protein EOM00_12630 [Clostridia bacterium]|nr:hypothetical protein [Clostridia bacterium]
MEYVDIIHKLEQVVPSHLQDLMAAIGLVSSELEYTKIAVDKNIQNAINQNDYNTVRELLEISEEIHKNKSKFDGFIEEHSSEEIVEAEDVIENDEEQHSNGVDYDAYRVDETVSYDLFTPITFKRPAAFSFKDSKYNVATWNGMLVKICGLLYQEDSSIFKEFVNDKGMQGKRKARFSIDKNQLRKGIKVKGSDVYIETNLSANDIRKTILAMLEKYSISSDAVKLYLAKDLTALHESE